MKPSDTDRIVVRRRGRKVHAPHHGGAWKIAYADYMTAMMAFFLVMWILSLIPRDDLSGIAEYFRMPLMTAIQGGPNIDNSSSVIPGGAPSPIASKHPITQPPVDSRTGDELRRDTQRLQDLKYDLETLIDTSPVLQEFRPQLLLDMTPDGLRIQIVDRQNRPMFATGRAEVQSYMRNVLRELGPFFNRLPNSITVAGHTDALQYASGERLYSNWELSADRANAARQEMVAGGMDEQKIKRVLGLSSTVPLIKEDPNAAVNRRISIVVLNREAEERIDAQNEAGSSDARLYEALQPAPVADSVAP
ncbi:MAG TPA: flagellar motor protein MotB [Pusillimonas sp.]|uniref:flagellar motor protein MotB n=1 Tax=Pusillimonas sp. TaxID=3040095 RepID=UPI002C0B5F11|nr:flagellar motor protein MotB [Pusillimonas sp.]HUH86733.1 flagellar motor protein MotB [Pusillimonas sp.]